MTNDTEKQLIDAIQRTLHQDQWTLYIPPTVQECWALLSEESRLVAILMATVLAQWEIENMED